MTPKFPLPIAHFLTKGENSYSLNNEGNIKALYLDKVKIRSLDVLPMADKLDVVSLENCEIKQIQSHQAFINLRKPVLVGGPFKQPALNNLVLLLALEKRLSLD